MRDSWAAGWKKEGEREGLESFFSTFSNPFQTLNSNFFTTFQHFKNF
jgi:hypothetical protein